MTRPIGTPGFEFPPLGPTGEGDPPYPGMAGQGYWVPERHTGYWVTHQGDRPAVAFRCHYPGGASPCDQDTADSFIEWAKVTAPFYTREQLGVRCIATRIPAGSHHVPQFVWDREDYGNDDHAVPLGLNDTRTDDHSATTGHLPVNAATGCGWRDFRGDTITLRGRS